METKFTPGPWKARKMSTHTAIESATRRVTHVSKCHGPGTDSDADARLIAAAPEMFALLERLDAWDKAPTMKPRQVGELAAEARALIERIAKG